MRLQVKVFKSTKLTKQKNTHIMELLSPFRRHNRFILYPNRITCTNFQERKESFVTEYFRKEFEKLIGIDHEQIKIEQRMQAVRAIKKYSFNLSKTSQNAIKQSIQSLYYLSPRRKQQISKESFYQNYKASFVTLTLPSVQVHSDTEIKKVLNNFLSTLRFHGLKNYVWKLELQKNGNVHFHLVIDKFFHYYYLQALWNKNLEKLGYVSEYTRKFSSMTYEDYYQNTKVLELTNNVKNPASDEVIRGRFNHGQQTKWKKPKTVDVRKIENEKQLISYLSKYIGKSIREDKADVSTTEMSENDKYRLESIGKCWGRSESLSKLKYKNALDEETIQYIKSIADKYPKAFTILIYDYCSLIYINSKEIPNSFKAVQKAILIGNAKLYNYPFPEINPN